MLTKYILFLSPALAVGWFGTRTALHIRHTKGGRENELVMLIVCWSPLVIWLLALLLSVFGSEP